MHPRYAENAEEAVCSMNPSFWLPGCTVGWVDRNFSKYKRANYLAKIQKL